MAVTNVAVMHQKNFLQYCIDLANASLLLCCIFVITMIGIHDAKNVDDTTNKRKIKRFSFIDDFDAWKMSISRRLIALRLSLAFFTLLTGMYAGYLREL